MKKEEFEERIEAGDFLEYAEVFGNYYGSSEKTVMEEVEKGKHVFLVIDTQGAMQVKEKDFPATFIFISPPSLAELRERLFKRKTEEESTIEQRLSWAMQEIEMAVNYDYHILNDNLHRAYEILRSIVIAEEHKVR